MYDNATKADARNWAWNRICNRWPARYMKRDVKVAVLIGDTNLELDTGIRKGFRAENIIGIDRRPEAVAMWREAGGTGICADLMEIDIPVDAAILDFCSGFNLNNYQAACYWLMRAGIVITNMLRGRDQVKKCGEAAIGKPRNLILLAQLTNNIIEHAPDLTTQEAASILHPEFFSYRSKDSNQYFDILKIERERFDDP